VENHCIKPLENHDGSTRESATILDFHNTVNGPSSGAALDKTIPEEEPLARTAGEIARQATPDPKAASKQITAGREELLLALARHFGMGEKFRANQVSWNLKSRIVTCAEMLESDGYGIAEADEFFRKFPLWFSAMNGKPAEKVGRAVPSQFLDHFQTVIAFDETTKENSRGNTATNTGEVRRNAARGGAPQRGIAPVCEFADGVKVRYGRKYAARASAED